MPEEIRIPAEVFVWIIRPEALQGPGPSRDDTLSIIDTRSIIIPVTALGCGQFLRRPMVFHYFVRHYARSKLAPFCFVLFSSSDVVCLTRLSLCLCMGYLCKRVPVCIGVYGVCVCVCVFVL